MSGFRRASMLAALLFIPAVLFFPIDRFFSSSDLQEKGLIFLDRGGYFFYFALLLFFIIVLANLEKNLLSLPALEKWRVKFEIIGAGVILGTSILYYSQSLLYRSLDMGLVPGKSVALLIGCGMIFYSFCRRGGLSGLYISREVATSSIVVLVIGIYFLSLGLAEKGLRYLGVVPQKAVPGLIAVLVGAAFFFVLFSETAKRKLKVFLHKHFYRQKYDYRNQWLSFTQAIIAKKNAEELGLAILAFFCETFAVHSAALFTRKEEKNGYVCLASWQMEPWQTTFSRSNSLVRYLDKGNWVFSTADQNKEIHAENEEFLSTLRITFIVPLQFGDKLEGFIVLGPQINPGEIATYEDYDLMRVLARQSANVLMSQQLIGELADQREMAAMGKISAFVIHDLKNLVTILDLTATNARDFIADPEFQKDLLSILDSSAERMKTLIARLKDFQGKKSLVKKSCDLMKIAEDCAKALDQGSVKIHGQATIVDGDFAEIQKVVLNLALNGLEACARKEPVIIEVGKESEAFLRVTDHGVGISRKFIDENLFRPFQSTKKKGFGIGLYQCKNIVEAHGGRIEVSSTEGEGSVFSVFFPLGQNPDVQKTDPADTRRKDLWTPC